MAVTLQGSRRALAASLGANPSLYAGYCLAWTRRPSSSSTPTSAPKGITEALDGPPQKFNTGSKFNKAWQIAARPDELALALENLKKGFFSETNAAPRARKHQDVLTLAEAITPGRDPFPLGASTVLKFAAAIKEAGFRSGPQYLGALRLAHQERDFVIGPALKRAFDLAKRALDRNAGPSNRAPEVQLCDFKKEGPNKEKGKLYLPKLTYGLALAFMLRRSELERLTLEDLIVNRAGGLVTLHIKKSKMDQRARGVKRTLGCACTKLSPALCPVECATRLKQSLLDGGLRDASNGKVWLTSTTDGQRATKSQVVKAWEEAAGRPVRGHSARRSGALFYVRAGVAIPDITYLGRWHSDLVFQYAEEAMEDRAANGSIAEQAPKKAQRVKQSADAGGPKASAPSTAPPLEDHRAEFTQPASSRPLLKPGELLTESPKWVKAHGRSRVVHLVENLGKPSSASWRTRCGWTFARATHFTLFITVPVGATKCVKCRVSPGQQRGRPCTGEVGAV